MFPPTKIANISLILIAAALTLSAAHAQVPACGITSMTETAAPIYPPIPKVAHIEGPVILMVRFSPNGTVERITTLSGAPMLLNAAFSFVNGWRANEYTGPRECPIVITFELTPGSCELGPVPTTPTPPVAPPPPAYSHIDMQHVTVRATGFVTCDPAADVIRRRKHFLIF
jgi:hypothetical protein